MLISINAGHAAQLDADYIYTFWYHVKFKTSWKLVSCHVELISGYSLPTDLIRFLQNCLEDLVNGEDLGRMIPLLTAVKIAPVLY